MPNPKKPTKTKVIQGTFRSDRALKNEPEPKMVEKLPNPPPVMPKEGKKIWKKLGQELLEKGLLTVVDIPAFEMCCFNYGLYRELADEVCRKETDPVTGKPRRRTLAEYMTGKNSQTMPEYTSMIKAFNTYKSFLAEFGLSPASRSRIDLPEVADEGDDPVKRMWNEG